MNNKQLKSDKSLSRSLQTIIRILDFDLLEEIKKRIKISKEVSIVDIGCGVGRSLWEISSIFSNNDTHLDLLGIFYSEKPDPNSLFFANQKRYEEILKSPQLIAQEFNIDTKNKEAPNLINTNACKKLPIASNSMDLVYSTNAFHYFEDKIGALKEVSRILKVNGIAIINIDRTDNDFWLPKLHFPRLRAYKGTKIVNVKKLLESKSGTQFTIRITKVNSYGTGKNSYILTMEKHQKGMLSFTELSFETRKSFSLDKIRCSKESYEEIIEYKRLIANGERFAKKVSKDNFGGYLSCYKLNE